MAIKSKREIERKTEEFVKNRKSELDRILYFVKNNEKGMGYESAFSSLKSMAAGISDLADIFKQWANDDRQGKLEESVKEHKTFRKYLAESVLPTDNEGYGFFGTCLDDVDATPKAEQFWEIASKVLAKERGWNPIKVRDWLDSKSGRHFADTVADFGWSEGGIKNAYRKWDSMGWFDK